MKLHFDECFDQDKILWVAQYLPATYAVLDELAPWRKGKWPGRVRCMSTSSIVDGRARGAGHGFTYTEGRGSGEIWMNPHMSELGHWLVLVHENCHHGWPDATEGEINCVLVPEVYRRVFGKKLTPETGRRHGLGAPAAGVGDRSYCR